MSKGLSFDELYPGQYIKAGEFQGKSVTLTIKSVKREMLSNGTGGEEGAVTVDFRETEKQWVMNKTCAVCLRAMWGDDSGDWIGHRVTLHPVNDESGLSESGKCIRVKGSPELTETLRFKARLGRKMVTQTLVPTGKPAVNAVTGEVSDEGPPTEDPATATETPQNGDESLSEAADAFTGPEPVKSPRAKTASEVAQQGLDVALAKEQARTIAARDVNWLATQCTIKEVEDAEWSAYLAETIGVGCVEDIPKSRLDDVKAWINGRPT